MNPSKLYVPNPQKWVKYFAKVADGKVKLMQTGSGRHMLTMDIDARGSKNQLPVKVVLPSEQTVAQAKSELRRDDINLETVVPKKHKQTHQRRRRTSKQNRPVKRKISKKKAKQTGGRRRTNKKNQTGGRRRINKKNKKLSKADILGF
jgi:hypothetical protein